MIRTLRRVAALLAITTATAAVWTAPAQAAGDVTATFTPGAAWTDTAGNPLQLHGLGIVRVGDTWYGFGEDKTGESASATWFQDIPCYQSTDLRTWTLAGRALTQQASGDLGPNRIVERPKVVHNPTTGKYVMYLHIDNGGYTDRKVGVAVSSTPCGPYDYLGSFRPLGNESLDIGVFQDTDGSAYLLSDDRPNGMRVDRLSDDYLTVASATALVSGPGYESPAMVHANGRYYLLASHQTGWSLNDNAYTTATSLSGPWSSFRNFAPVGTNTYQTQTANIITVSGAQGTSYVYAGDRWTGSNLGTSPLVWLPLTLSGGTANVGWQNAWTLDLTAGSWAQGTSNPASGSTHELVNANSNLVADVSGASTADGAPVIQWTNHSGANQQWTLTQVAGNAFTVTNVHSGRCLHAVDTASGSQLDQRACTGAADQLWAFDAVGSYTSAGNSGYQLVNLASGLVADVSGGSTTAGAAVIQWPSNGGRNQQWNLS